MNLTFTLFLAGLLGLGVYFVSLVVRIILAVATARGEVRSQRLYRCLMGFLIWTAASFGFFFVVFLVSAFQQGAGMPAQGEEHSGFRFKVGQPAPDFEFEPVDGKPRRLSDLRGQTVVVDFFATWCGPCMYALPELDRKIARPFQNRGVVVIAVGLGHSRDDLEQLQQQEKFRDSAIVFVPDPRQSIFAKFTEETTIPRTVLIKPDGTIGKLAVGYSPDELASMASLAEKNAQP
jgi:peroxiredoxin